MRKMYLIGGVAANFAQLTAPFVEGAGGSQARIALLFPSGEEGWDRFLPFYQRDWGPSGATILPVRPDAGTGELGAAALEALRTCTGIFMCGGDTRQYRRLYAQGEARELIRTAYYEGRPYAGFSAGALVVPAVGTIWGDRLTLPGNRLTLRGSEDGCDAELELGEGLGLLTGLLIEAHFSELGGFPRLVAAMEQAGINQGLVMDDPICLEISDERLVRVHGQGRAFQAARTGAKSFALTVWEPGESFSL